MAQAEVGSQALRRAVACRNGRNIVPLAAWPWRRNFVARELGRHLVRAGASWRLVIQGAETKSGRPFELPFPEGLVPMLQRYVPGRGHLA
jgi:hypothetical protein